MIQYQISQLLSLKHDKTVNLDLQDLIIGSKPVNNFNPHIHSSGNGGGGVGTNNPYRRNVSFSSLSSNHTLYPSVNGYHHNHLQSPMQFRFTGNNRDNVTTTAIDHKIPSRRADGNSHNRGSGSAFCYGFPVSGDRSFENDRNNFYTEDNSTVNNNQKFDKLDSKSSSSHKFQNQSYTKNSNWIDYKNNNHTPRSLIKQENFQNGNRNGNFVYLPVSPSYRLVQIPPGMPIPNDAIPAVTDCASSPIQNSSYGRRVYQHDPQTVTTTTATATATTTSSNNNGKRLSAIEQVRLEFKQNLFQTAFKVKQKYQDKSKKVKFVYDPSQPPKQNNPYSISGFFPSSLSVEPSKVNNCDYLTIGSHSTFNSIDVSDNDSYNQSTLGSSYDVQIQLPKNF